MSKISRVFGALLALGVLGIAGTIEVLNSRAGGVLPRHEYWNSDPTAGLVKWRSSFVVNEKNWLRALGPRAADGTPVSRPLSPDEHARMEQDIRLAQSDNLLRAVISTAGLLQYLLVPALLTASLLSWRAKSNPKWVATQFIITISAAFLMFYRGYFSSLGW